MTSETKPGVWQFVLTEGGSNRWTPVIIREANERFPQDIETKKFGAAMFYKLRDGSEVLIADDGEARGEGQQTTKPNDFPNGRCTRGTKRDTCILHICDADCLTWIC